MEHKERTKKFKAIIPALLILSMLLSGVINACVVTYTDKNYANNEKTSIVNPTFYYFINCTNEETVGSVTLNISGVYTNSTASTAITNGTENYFTAVTALSYSATGYTYSIVLVNASGTYLNASTARVLYVTRLGSIESLIGEMSSLLNSMIPVIVPIAVIILFFVVVLFMTGLFDGITSKLSNKFSRL